MGGNSEIFCFSPQERSSHEGGWPPHPPVPGWKPDYKQCARGWRGILHVQCLQQQQLCQCQLRGEGAEEPAQQWVQLSLPASPSTVPGPWPLSHPLCASPAPALGSGEQQEPVGRAASGAQLSMDRKQDAGNIPDQGTGSLINFWGQNAVVCWSNSWLHDL